MKTYRLDGVYGAKTPEESRSLYNKWSSQYDADTLSLGFRLPALGAGLLARYLGHAEGPVLDACCGTGLVGETLHILGYRAITGCDISPDMMAQATTTGAYQALIEANAGEALPFEDDYFAGFVCVGAFGPGHAPPSTLRHLARVTRHGGIGVFNLIEDSYEDQGFGKVIRDLQGNGTWEVQYTSPPFLPFLLAEPDLWSRAWVVRILPD